MKNVFEWVRKLESVGFTREQAEALVQVTCEIVTEHRKKSNLTKR